MEKENLSVFENDIGFKVLFECASIGILVVGNKGTIQMLNPNAENLFGYSIAELIGKPIETLIPKGSREAHTKYTGTYFDHPNARPMGVGLDLFGQKKDGQIFPVEVSLGSYRLNDEQFAVAFITDITKRKESEQNLKKITEDLENLVMERTRELTNSLESQKNLSAIKSRFVSMASHEFRTPLSSVLTSISLLESYIDNHDTEKSKKHIERIKSSINNMTGILDDFLSLEKLEQGIIDIKNETILIEEFCKDVSEELNGIIKSGQKINILHIGKREIVADKKVLRHILLNLLSNAVKYSAVNNEIHLQTDLNDERVLIQVKDKGIGVPEDEQKNLFSPFFRAKNASSIQGTGLGLNIVKRYVDMLKGSISYAGGSNEGSIFSIQIPLKEN